MPGSLFEWQGESRSESKKLAACEELGVNVPGVTQVRPEAGRSKPGQGEAGVRPRGGLKRFYVQVFF